MLSYIKKYPVSLFIILAVIYLSFFKPPSTEISKIPNIDKVVHICMYFGMSGMLWLEFLRAHRRDHTPVWHAWVGAFMSLKMKDQPGACSDSTCRNIVRPIVGETGWTLQPIPQVRYWPV